jgi:3-phenylpropionate/trans-cinnamate dioxygenase ferredoxin reductase subunit
LNEQVVIAGAGHAAGQCVATLRQKKFAGSIVLLGNETWLPYQRPPLSKKYLAGELSAERLHFKPQSFYADIDVRLGATVTGIDRENRLVQTMSGESVDYDKLVIATGSRPRTMSVPGIDLDGVHYLRSIDDVDRIRSNFHSGKRVVIVGAGYIGLEVAAVAAQLGLAVTVVEMEDRVMRRVVSPQLSDYYQGVHEQHGVNIRLKTTTSAFAGEQHLESVVLESGEKIAADIAVIGIGIVPNIELAASAGLRIDDGIVVDDHCQSSDANIFAIGDCTMHPNALLQRSLRLESVHNALEQAKTAAANICGEDVSYAQVPWFWSDQYDLKLQIAGISQGYDQTVLRGDPDAGAFACMYLRQGCLIAVDAVNSPKDFMQSKALIANHAKIDPVLLADADTSLKDLAA